MIKSIKKNQIKKNCLSEASKILAAVKILNKSKIKIVFVIRQGKFLGTITNGDIRQCLSKGIQLSDPIIYAINKHPIVLKNDLKKNFINEILVKNKINIIPYISKNKKIEKVYFKTDTDLKRLNTHLVFMAGGRGKRLYPLTKTTPKPLLKISGKPMLEHLIIKALKYGYKNIYITVNYLKDKIIKHFRNGEILGANIKYIKETKPLGTIGSLSFLNKKKISKNFLVLNCDIVTNINLNELEDYHNYHKSFMTIVSYVKRSSLDYGVVQTKGIKLVNFLEKPIINHYINAGIYVFNKKVLDFIHYNKKIDINELIKRIKKKRKKIIIYPLYEPWSDIGHKKELSLHRVIKKK